LVVTGRYRSAKLRKVIPKGITTYFFSHSCYLAEYVF